jgi:hypothetical protein
MFCEEQSLSSQTISPVESKRQVDWKTATLHLLGIAGLACRHTPSPLAVPPSPIAGGPLLTHWDDIIINEKNLLKMLMGQLLDLAMKNQFFLI